MGFKRVTCFMLMLATIAWLNAESAQSILNRITAHYQSVKNMKADFIQYNEWPSMKTKKTSKGSLAYDQTHLKMTYTDPSGQVLLINGKDVTMLDAQQKQAMLSRITDVVEGIKPIEIIRHYSSNAKLETITRGSQEVLRITPKNTEDVRRIDVVADMKGAVKEISYSDKSGNSVRYVFSNIRENASMPSFLITIPKDYEKIDGRQ